MFPQEPVPETLGTYKVLKRLSGSGSTAVYLARVDGPLGFQRNCELKLVPNTTEGDKRFAEELAREAWICSQLNHPSVVRMFDFFEHEDMLVLVLEHVEGVHLDRLLRHLVSRRQKLGDASVYYIVHRLAGALAHAHNATDQQAHPAPVIHRNIHPGNVVIAWNGEVRLTGFGLGKILGRSPDTVVGTVKGTPGYMAPEQTRGERATPKADIYALGLLLWAMLTGRRPPMDGTRPAQISSVRPDIPQPVMAVVEAALATKPEERKTDAATIERTLSRVMRAEVGKGELVRIIQSVHATIELEDGSGADRRPTIPVKGKGSPIFKPPASPKLPAEALGLVELDPEEEVRPEDLVPVPVSEGAAELSSADLMPAEPTAPGSQQLDPAVLAAAAKFNTSSIRFGTPPPPPPEVLEQLASLHVGPLPPLPGAPGAPGPGGIQFGSPPPTLPTGLPMRAGPTPLPTGLPMSAGPTPLPAQFGPPPGSPMGGTPSNPATEFTQPRSFMGLLQTHRSMVGTVAVSAATATLVAVVWLALASSSPSSPDGGNTETAPSARATASAASAKPSPTSTPATPSTPVTRSTGAATATKAGAQMEQVNASELPPGVGFLTVTFPANAKVYISGRYLGMANKPLQVRCGQWFVRLARPTDTRIPDWVSAGKSVSVACQGVTQVAMQPTPGKALE